MVATIKSRRPVVGVRKIVSLRGPLLSPENDIKQVQAWLSAKGFSEL